MRTRINSDGLRADYRTVMRLNARHDVNVVDVSLSGGDGWECAGNT